jgi:hypothetical protein
VGGYFGFYSLSGIVVRSAIAQDTDDFPMPNAQCPNSRMPLHSNLIMNSKEIYLNKSARDFILEHLTQKLDLSA